MAKNHTITGLDIGTTSIKAITCVKRPESPDLEVLGQVQLPVLGMRRGVVVDIDEVSKSINLALTELQNITSQKIEEVYVNINGSHIFVTPSHGTVVVSRADQKISEEDINRVIGAAQAFSLGLNKEILDVFPREFIVDGERGIKEARDMHGIRLEVEILALCASSPYLKNLTSAVLNAGIQIADIIPSPLASARSCLSPQQKELGAVLIDIGGGTTGFAVYEEGDLVHIAILPIGSSHITNDIAVGLRTDVDIAERIKREFGSCIFEGANKKEKIELPGEASPLVFSHKMLTEIIEARVCEIFDLIKKGLKETSPRGLLPAGIVLTGGGAKLPKIVELAKKELKLPARIGVPRVIGLEENPTLSTVCGLVLEGTDAAGNQSFSILGKGLRTKIKKIFKTFIP